MLLCAALMQTAGTVVGPGHPEAWGAFGAMLLREDAGGYVLVAVVSFAAAVVITALCNEKTNAQHPAHVLYGADTAANNGFCGGKHGNPACLQL